MHWFHFKQNQKCDSWERKREASITHNVLCIHSNELENSLLKKNVLNIVTSRKSLFYYMHSSFWKGENFFSPNADATKWIQFFYAYLYFWYWQFRTLPLVFRNWFSRCYFDTCFVIFCSQSINIQTQLL